MKRFKKSEREQQFAMYLQQQGINTAHDAKYRAGLVRTKLSELEGRDIYAINDLSEIKRICEEYDNYKYRRYENMSKSAISACVSVAGHYPNFLSAMSAMNRQFEDADFDAEARQIQHSARGKIADADSSDDNSVITCYGLWWKLSKTNFARKRMTCMYGEKSLNMYRQKGIYVLYDVRHPIYVGQSEGEIGERLKKHTTNHLAEQWDRFSWFGICPFDANGNLREPRAPRPARLLNALEGLLITILNPEQNKKTGEGWLREVEQLYQE